MEYWLVGLLGSDVLYGLRISWCMELCLSVYCSEISCLCWWYDWIYSCSYGNNGEVLLLCFNKVMVSLIGPYSCLLFMCSAYADWGSLCLIYLMCSWYLCFKLRLVCPIYDIWHVLHVSLQMPHLTCFWVLLVSFGFVCCCMVLVLLNDICILVCLNRFLVLQL
jgi:hypothetical protein